MKSPAGKAIVICCLSIVGIASLAIAMIGTGVLGFSQEAPTPKLFAMGYQAGEELAGFSGRPMVLVFGDKSNPAWNEFLISCEADPEIASLLNTKFTGIFVDINNDSEISNLYDAEKPGKILVVDIHGPILGALEGNYTVNDIGAMIKNISIPFIEKSSLYAELILRKEKVIKELSEASMDDEVLKALELLNKIEGNSDLYQACKTEADRLGVKG